MQKLYEGINQEIYANVKMHYTFEIKEYQIPINYDKI